VLGACEFQWEVGAKHLGDFHFFRQTQYDTPKDLALASGNLTWLWEITKITIFDGTIHYFYGHFQ